MKDMKVANVIFLRSNPVAPEPRVEKEAKTLFLNGYNVIILAWDRTGSLPEKEIKDFALIQRIRIVAPFGEGFRNILNLLRWNFCLLSYLFRHRERYQIIHACDFDTILPALLMRLLFHKKVVYDICDFYADSRFNLPVWLRNLIRKTEIWAIGEADALILPDRARVEQIKGSNPRKLEFIYNSPEKVQCDGNFARSNSQLLITYVGIFDRVRGLVEMIDIVARHLDWRLNLAGFGRDENMILEHACKLPNVNIFGRIPYRKALELYSEADALFATYDPSIPNHRYSSPNKLFEAMMLGKPIIVCEGTGMDSIVKAYGLGFVIKYGDVNNLEKILIEIASWNHKFREKFSERARSIYENHFSWEIMAERLVNLYRELI